MTIRAERVASLIKEEIGEILTREYNGSGIGFTTVTDVRMTPDLKIARVYFSVFGTPEVQKKSMSLLEEERQHMRGILGSRIHLKFIPALQFYLDDTLNHVDRINTIIKKIHDDAGGNSGSNGA